MIRRPEKAGLPGLTLVAAALLLVGCGDRFFGAGNDGPPLPGERISLMSLTPEIETDPNARDIAIELPPAQALPTWPGAGGQPGHVNGHLAFQWPAERVWSQSVGDGADSNRRLIAAPVVAEGQIYALDSTGHVARIDLASGERVWRIRVADPREDSVPLGGGVALASGMLYVTTGFGEVLALDPANGGLVWRQRTRAPIRGAPAADGARVLAITVDSEVEAFDARTGEPLWNHAGLLEDAAVLGGTSPAIGPGVAIVPFASGEVFALRLESGRVAWSDNLAAVRRFGALASLPDIRALPVTDGELAIAASHSGRMVALELRSGARLWEQAIPSIQMPWLAGDWVFAVSTNAQVVGLFRPGGNPIWVSQLEQYRNPADRIGPITWYGPVLAGDRLVVASSEGDLVTLSPQDGQEIDRRRIRGGGAVVAPLVVDRTLLVLAEDGTLTAYR